MKTVIRLHGKLGKIYGKEFSFGNIYKPMDIITAIDVIRPGFKKEILSSLELGAHYEMIINNETLDSFQLEQSMQIKTVDIIPCIMGAGLAAAVFSALSAVIGGALSAISAAINAIGGLLAGLGSALTASSFVTAFATSLAVGLIIAGVMYAMTPIPEPEPDEASIKSSVKNSSFIFQNPRNVASQGKPVPIAYGKLRVGSMVIGTSITNYNLENDFQNQTYESYKSAALLKLQDAFGSSIKNQFRGY
jgi:predicted phage tail protein